MKFWGFFGLASLLASVQFPAGDKVVFVNPQISEARCRYSSFYKTNEHTLANGRLSIEEKNVELTKYRDLVLATLDYYLEKPKMMIKTSDYDSSVHFKNLKLQTEEHFAKGRLSKLKQWFRDLTEMQIETVDLEFNNYLKNKTKYDIDIFKSYYQRIDKVIVKEKITTDNQFYDINIMVDQLCQTEPVDNEKIEILNKLLGRYEQRKSQKTRKTNA